MLRCSARAGWRASSVSEGAATRTALAASATATMLAAGLLVDRRAYPPASPGSSSLHNRGARRIPGPPCRSVTSKAAAAASEKGRAALMRRHVDGPTAVRRAEATGGWRRADPAWKTTHVPLLLGVPPAATRSDVTTWLEDHGCLSGFDGPGGVPSDPPRLWRWPAGAVRPDGTRWAGGSDVLERDDFGGGAADAGALPPPGWFIEPSSDSALRRLAGHIPQSVRQAHPPRSAPALGGLDGAALGCGAVRVLLVPRASREGRIGQAAAATRARSCSRPRPVHSPVVAPILPRGIFSAASLGRARTVAELRGGAPRATSSTTSRPRAPGPRTPRARAGLFSSTRLLRGTWGRLSWENTSGDWAVWRRRV